jgi:predicted nucleic acid-binding protein
MRKRIICDSSSLISMSMNCMLPLVVELSEAADFVISQSVYDEIITNPKRLGHHVMGPLNFSALVKSGVLRVERADEGKAKDILNLSNTTYYAHHQPLTIIQKGEAEALALAHGGATLLIDERTLRFLIESPAQLLGLLQFRLRKGITMNSERARIFQSHYKGIPIIRSSEIVAVAYEKGILGKYFEGSGREVLSACLYSLKSKGCSLSNSDIEDYLRTLL